MQIFSLNFPFTQKEFERILALFLAQSLLDQLWADCTPVDNEIELPANDVLRLAHKQKRRKSPIKKIALDS